VIPLAGTPQGWGWVTLFFAVAIIVVVLAVAGLIWLARNRRS
jgi:heme/copper-type cytochrome/quinol oxidase subunit 4